jgi:hypothetical protein
VKEHHPKNRKPLSPSTPEKKFRMLKRCLRELQALYAEAIHILDELLIGPPVEVVRSLCARFYILQEYFAMRYHEARTHAIAALGHVEAALSFS